MFFPHVTNHQTVTDFANSAKETINVIHQSTGGRTNELEELFGRRVHELMRFRTHTVNTDY